MKIDLANTKFDMKAVVNELPSSNVFFKGKVNKLPDFGCVLISDVEIPEDLMELIEEISINPESPVFLAPVSWRMPNVLKAVGAFQSTSQARKNGWDKDIDEGMTEVVVRIAKVRGVLTIHKVTKDNPWFS